MGYDILAKRNFVRADWPSRRESPSEIAERLRRYMDRLVAIDESLKTWSVGQKLRLPYDVARDGLSELVRSDVSRDEMGHEDANEGFDIGGRSGDDRQLYRFRGTVGGIYPWPAWNRTFFETTGGRTPDPKIVAYRLVKAVTLATISAWEPLFCLAGSSDLRIRPEDDRYYRAWITYVPPAHAAGLDLVGVPFSERTPDGGLLLSATEEVFDAKNPSHVEGARIIADAVRPLNATLPK